MIDIHIDIVLRCEFVSGLTVWMDGFCMCKILSVVLQVWQQLAFQATAATYSIHRSSGQVAIMRVC